MVQDPPPGASLIRHQGDVATFTLELSSDRPGRAYIRTNLARASRHRREVVAHVHEGLPVLSRDWHDLPMRPAGPGRFELRVALAEVGVFEAKAFFLPSAGGGPLWPEGPNARIKVEPADTVCANTVYTAFVRMFRPEHRPEPDEERCTGALDARGYTVIPPSGTFRELARRLDHIMGDLRCRILQLLPIHPVPTTYARMGRFGSPFAVLDFFDVDPALAEFDRRTTPLGQFRELVDAVHQRAGRIFLDIPINHTGWASWLQIHHPHWFARDEARRFASPGAWGVTWEDLSKLDYAHRDLWRYMGDVFLYWCRQGVDGFRCDAGYMVPVPVWEYLVARVREEFPGTVFLLEGLGGPVETTETLLGRAGLDWAYSELFQNYDRAQIEGYLPVAERIATTCGLLVHYAETHDNNRLAATSPGFARLRTALTALLSRQGAFGITCGVEWLATEKIDVHGAPAMRWGAPDNLVGWIARLHAVLESHPSFLPGAGIGFVHRGGGNALAVERRARGGAHPLLVLANLEAGRPGRVVWDPAATPGPELLDLLDGARVRPEQGPEGPFLDLGPGQVRCLSADPADLDRVEAALGAPPGIPGPTLRQRLRAKVLELAGAFRPGAEPPEDLDDLAARLPGDPAGVCARLAGRSWAPVTRWTWPRDARRRVMVPPGSALVVEAAHPFRADLKDGDRVLVREDSVPGPDGKHLAVIAPRPPREAHRPVGLALRVHAPGGTDRLEAPLLLLGAGEPKVRLRYGPGDMERLRPYALCTNGRGAMAQVRSGWAEIESLYDAVLAGNLDPAHPVDRHVMLTRLRGWVVYRGYSQELRLACTTGFALEPDGRVRWEFLVPCGMGRQVRLDARLAMVPDENAVHLEIERRPAGDDPTALPDGEAVRVILRPDVEDRSVHGHTKAYAGPEKAWPGAVRPESGGFSFSPSPDRTLRVAAIPGTFTPEPQWLYAVDHPWEGSRGIDPESDLFSPGYLSLRLDGGERALVRAEILTGAAPLPGPCKPRRRRPAGATATLGAAVRAALEDFLAARDGSLTVIAGYPWFLDWGRDTLIFLRGAVAAGLVEEAAEILTGFARLEDRGTIPNMIRGADTGDRDTSDAPLWLLVAAGDLADAAGEAVLDRDCGGRPLREVLRSIAESYLAGTPNGIRADPDTGLVFSPAHFTWMDTNHPAGTPRQGFPVEIQALWHAGLGVVARADGASRWEALRYRVRGAVEELFPVPGQGFLADCLHAEPGRGAREARADDHLRPNQLLAVTLGLVEDHEACRPVLEACQELLVPGAIRSLADRPVRYRLPVEHEGRLLNDPERPYWGRYEGDEDTRRKPAYHNGTAWTWVFPAYAEALVRAFGDEARAEALALLGSSTLVVDAGCTGHVPEILDGDLPHAQRGCGAQAWGASELYRVLALLGRGG